MAVPDEDALFAECRGNGTLQCNVELGTATMVAIKLAVESYRQKKTLAWDAKSERVVG